MRLSITTASLVAGLLGAAAPALASDAYPARPVQMIVPVAAGGGLDAVARLVGQRLSDALGQPIVIENRPGGAQNIGIRSVARSAPDGYTVLYASNTITINPSLFKKLDYDVNTDLIPIGKVASLPLLVVADAAAPYKSLPDLIAYAKANPGKLSYGTPGAGTPHHLGMELLKSAADIDIQHIAYKGSAAGLTDLLGGSIPLLVTTASPVQGHLQSGKLRAVVTLDPKRVDGVEAVSETLPDFNVSVWQGMFVPAGTPQAIVSKLTSTLEGVVTDPGVAKQLSKMGVVATWVPSAELRTAIKDEQAQWAAAIQKAGIPAR